MKNEDLEKQFAEFLQQENSQNEIKNAKIEILENDNSETAKSEKELKIDKSKSIENLREVTKPDKIQSENIKINFQISHLYIFGLIATSLIILNIAVWSLIFSLISIINYYLIPFDYRFTNSGIFQSLMLIIFVYCNYRLHTKFLKEIFGNLEI